MITLGIETSCDETALCLLETIGDGVDIEYRILGNIINSQIDLHREYGGVYPTLAKREHIKNLPILFKKLLEDSGIKENEITGKIDRIAVTAGPGLEPALWTGILFARELHEKYNIPVIPVNHMEGHIVSVLFNKTDISNNYQKLKSVNFPALAILISGGHTQIIRVDEIGKYKILGNTKDDAIGEAFDKVARMLELPYPGGPEISKLAEQARIENIANNIKLPRPMIYSKDLNMSFSGLKTAVLYTLRNIENITEDQKKDIAREFEDSVTEVLISKTEKVIEDREYMGIIVGGGVIANRHIRKAFKIISNKYNIPLYLPESNLTGDNALMIALAGILNNKMKNPPDISALGNLSFDFN